MSELVLILLLQQAPCHHAQLPDDYDRTIKTAVRKYWPSHTHALWCWAKVQLYVESNFREDAVSPVGARGIAQVMPATWAEESKRLGITCSPFNARCSIEVGVAYMGKMLKIYTSPRPVFDLMCWQAVSYNAGAGSALKAQVKGETENCKRALDVLHEVTGPHAEETRGYIARIHKWLPRLLSR